MNRAERFHSEIYSFYFRASICEKDDSDIPWKIIILFCVILTSSFFKFPFFSRYTMLTKLAVNRERYDDSESIIRKCNWPHVSAIIFQFFQVIMLAKSVFKYPGIKLKSAQSNGCLSSGALVVHTTTNRSFNFTSWKRRERLWNVKIWNTHVQNVQNCLHMLFFVVKYANCWRRFVSYAN